MSARAVFSPTALVILFASLPLVGCAETTVTILTQAPPGRVASVDIEEQTLVISRGLAVALDCVEWTDSYAGPCRQMEVILGDDSLADVLPVHLDALAGQGVRTTSGSLSSSSTLRGPADRQGAVLAALEAGESALEVRTAGAPVVMTLVVVEQPGRDGDDGGEAAAAP
jgi:hypothetical protein